MEEELEDPIPQFLTQCSTGGRPTAADPKSPEFEFWMVRNPSFPQPNLLTADQLFSHGVLLPLHHLRLSEDPPLPSPPPELDPSGSDQAPKPESLTAELSAASALTSSKRWRDIFKKSDRKSAPASADGGGDDHGNKEKDNSVKERKREKKNGGAGGGSNGVAAAELNINIWPFSRSRSAGNAAGARPRSAAAAANRKVCSAPCSRSNSAGESKSRKWPSSPGRGGVHLGRSSPVWQIRRGGGGRSSEAAGKSADHKGAKKDGNGGRRKIPAAAPGGGVGPKGKVLSLNVPMCIGYRSQLSCRSDHNNPEGVAIAAPGSDQKGGGISGEGVRGSNLFSIKSLFTKKVY